MTVAQLRDLLFEAPDDMLVYIMTDVVFGNFVFKEACECDSGLCGFGDVIDDDGDQLKGFVIFPHGANEAAEDDQIELN